MSSASALVFKIATEPRELEQVHALNYRTFVEEIPQHGPNPEGRLVDRFHDENTYIVCLRGGELLGMLAVRDRRPFSLDARLPDLDSYLPPARSVCELRLLAVAPGRRNGVILRGMGRELLRLCRERGYDLAVMSGTLRQSKLYAHLGCVPFGPVVGTPEARYQPMYLTPAAFAPNERLVTSPRAPDDPRAPVNLLPGPVAVRPDVREAFERPPHSHRGEAFGRLMRETRGLLRGLTRAADVQILLGSGTLANDLVAAQLSLLPGRGLILSAGEFGERLLDHAARMGLSFDSVRSPWGWEIPGGAVERALDAAPDIGWVWGVHCETSTGALLDVAALDELCAPRGIRLCLDCISSLGVVPLDLSRVYLASGVSGKGLGAYPGLSMVFHDHPVAPARLPRSLDLGLYAATDSVPFTHSSNLLAALHAAVRGASGAPRKTGDLSAWLRAELEAAGMALVTGPRDSPAVLTIALPASVRSGEVGRRLEEGGYLVSCNSSYLIERNWIQLCLMGEYTFAELSPLPGLLRALCHPAISPDRDRAAEVSPPGQTRVSR